MSDDIDAPTEPGLPAGYAPVDWRRGFGHLVGPLYRRIQDGATSMAFRVNEQHTNGMANAHGGMLMTFADMAWGQIVSIERSAYWVTVRLTVDFLASAHLGEWVEASGDLLSARDDLFIVRGKLWSGERLLATGTGVFKPLAAREPRPGEKAYKG